MGVGPRSGAGGLIPIQYVRYIQWMIGSRAKLYCSSSIGTPKGQVANRVHQVYSSSARRSYVRVRSAVFWTSRGSCPFPPLVPFIKPWLIFTRRKGSAFPLLFVDFRRFFYSQKTKKQNKTRQDKNTMQTECRKQEKKEEKKKKTRYNRSVGNKENGKKKLTVHQQTGMLSAVLNVLQL